MPHPQICRTGLLRADSLRHSDRFLVHPALTGNAMPIRLPVPARASSSTATAKMRTWAMPKPFAKSLLTLVTLGAMASGCGSDGTISVGGEERQLVEIERADSDTDLVEYVSSAMDGVRFSVDSAHHLYVRGDTIVVSIVDPAGAAAWESASIGLLTQTADGLPIDSVDQVLDLMTAVPSAEVTSTGTAIEVLGHRLAGYDVRAGASARDHFIVAADRIGSPASALFGFTPNARVFLGETPAGVLVAASSEADEVSNIENIDVALGTLLATIEITGDGLDQTLPRGSTLERDGLRESTARGELDPDGVAALDAPFSAIEPGAYQLANFGPTFTLDFDSEWFVQPNFPGLIVLTGSNGGGPGDRDLVFATGFVDVIPVAPGPVTAGDPIRVVTADDVINALSGDIEISERQVVDLGGLAATRFDVRIAADASCSQADPCEYAFRTSWGFVKPLSPTHSHRIWWIEDGAEGPSMIIAMAPYDHDFIERATELLSTMTITS